MRKILGVRTAAGMLCLSAAHLLAQDVIATNGHSRRGGVSIRLFAQPTRICRAFDSHPTSVTPWRAEAEAFGLAEAAAVELSPEDRQKGQPAYREMQESRRAFDEASKTWEHTRHQLVVDHVPSTGASGWVEVTLPGGTLAKVPFPGSPA